MAGGKQDSSPEIDQLGQFARALFNETAGLRKEFNKQGLEALRTGGVTSNIPLINRAVEASKSQLSGTMKGTYENLAKHRLAGTPFGQAILANTQQAGESHIADIGPQFAQNFISQLPSFMAAMTGSSIGGMGNAASAQSNVVSSSNNAYAQILSAGIPRTNFSFSAGTGGGG